MYLHRTFPDPRSGGSEDDVDARIRFDQLAQLPNFEAVSPVLISQSRVQSQSQIHVIKVRVNG